MSRLPQCYFIRANGDTLHSNPRNRGCYVPDEPPGGGRFFNHVNYCLREGIARVGWPDTGDLRHVPRKVGALCDCYHFDSPRIEPHQRAYLLALRAIAPGSIALLPDRSQPGSLFIGDVTGGYHYFHAPPDHPYECAHRVRVRWDRTPERFVRYEARDLGIPLAGFWRRAFHHIDSIRYAELIGRIQAARRKGT